MTATYKKTEKLTNDGQTIYHKIVGRGRPALFVKKGDRYVAWKRPIVAKAKVAKAPVADPVTA